MNKNELARKIYNTSRIEGVFKLRSGQISNEYFDKYLFSSNPELLSIISDNMVDMIPEHIEVIAGLELGAIPLATLLSHKTGLPCIFVRKTAKLYGTNKLAEGIDFSGKNVLVIEDVVTTGGQILEGVSELRKLGAFIDTACCVIQRTNVSIQSLVEADIHLISLFTMDYLREQL